MMTDPTQRQLQALRVYIECGSRQEAARILKLHERTIDYYLKLCRDSFGVANSAQAVVIAIQRGLIDPYGVVIAACALQETA